MYKKINSRIYQRFSVLVSILFISIILSQSVVAWDNCPFGEVNESYPGTCGRYTDTDKDNICDLSQSAPEFRENTIEDNNNVNNPTTGKNVNIKSNTGRNYYFVPIALFLFAIYLITLYLLHKKKIKLSLHRKIWNFVLLISFLISGIFGIILAIIVSYGIIFSFHSDLLFWHVEIGIAMAIISIFHISWYIKYFKKMFQLKK